MRKMFVCDGIGEWALLTAEDTFAREPPLELHRCTGVAASDRRGGNASDSGVSRVQVRVPPIAREVACV